MWLSSPVGKEVLTVVTYPEKSPWLLKHHQENSSAGLERCWHADLGDRTKLLAWGRELFYFYGLIGLVCLIFLLLGYFCNAIS